MGAVAGNLRLRKIRKESAAAVASELLWRWLPAIPNFYTCTAALLRHCLAGKADDFCLLFLVVKGGG